MPPNRRARIIHAALFALILAAGAALRVWGIDARSLWHDEGYSLAFVRLGAGAMNHALAFDVHPPLYYWLLRFWMLLGHSVTWARLFSALCSAATLPVAYALARSLAGPRIALGAMAFLAISPQAIYYGQELRMYSLQALLIAAMMVFGLAALRRPDPWRIGATLVCGVAATYTHYFSAPFLIGFLIVLAFVRRDGEPDVGRAMVRAAVSALVSTLLYLPWLYTAMGHVLINSFHGLRSAEQTPSLNPTVDFLNRALETSLGFIPAFPFDHWLFPSPAALAAVRQWTALGFAGALFLLFLLGLARLRAAPGARPFFAAFLVIPWLLALAFMSVGGRFYPRFVLPMLPLGFACAAQGIASLPPRFGVRPSGRMKRIEAEKPLRPEGRIPNLGRWIRWVVSAAVGAVLLSSSIASLRVDIRDVSRNIARDLDRARVELNAEAAAAPVLHAGAHSFWTLMGYDPTPGRHRLLDTPLAPALARLVYGRSILVRGSDLKQWSAVWVAYSEWGPGPPRLRQEIERRWFGEGWRVVESLSAARYNKRMEAVLYERTK
ncbi:MAG: glycosyltransferase family 39 protein [Candidatus Sumerlaeota bacterium]|nr:glycosyltransferase family 39 protein [Candidatus Sumerlaeota bacterium]